MRFRHQVFCFAALLTMTASAASAQVTVGTATSANCFPFQCGALTRYQEIYSASAFSGPLLITNIGFFTDLAYGDTKYNDGTFSLSLGITAVAPSAIGPAGTNTYTNGQSFFSGLSLNGTVNDPVFGGTPYLYNPALGNLILDFTITGASYAYVGGYLKADYSGDCKIARAYISSVEGPDNTCGGALVTRFNGTKPVDFGTGSNNVVPEPSTVALLSAGLLGVFGFGLRRKTRA
jgi:hypothetical protein